MGKILCLGNKINMINLHTYEFENTLYEYDGEHRIRFDHY